LGADLGSTNSNTELGTPTPSPKPHHDDPGGNPNDVGDAGSLKRLPKNDNRLQVHDSDSGVEASGLSWWLEPIESIIGAVGVPGVRSKKTREGAFDDSGLFGAHAKWRREQDLESSGSPRDQAEAAQGRTVQEAHHGEKADSVALGDSDSGPQGLVLTSNARQRSSSPAGVRLVTTVAETKLESSPVVTNEAKPNARTVNSNDHPKKIQVNAAVPSDQNSNQILAEETSNSSRDAHAGPAFPVRQHPSDVNSAATGVAVVQVEVNSSNNSIGSNHNANAMVSASNLPRNSSFASSVSRQGSTGAASCEWELNVEEWSPTKTPSAAQKSKPKLKIN